MCNTQKLLDRKSQSITKRNRKIDITCRSQTLTCFNSHNSVIDISDNCEPKKFRRHCSIYSSRERIRKKRADDLTRHLLRFLGKTVHTFSNIERKQYRFILLRCDSEPFFVQFARTRLLTGEIYRNRFQIIPEKAYFCNCC